MATGPPTSRRRSPCSMASTASTSCTCRPSPGRPDSSSVRLRRSCGDRGDRRRRPDPGVAGCSMASACSPWRCSGASQPSPRSPTATCTNGCSPSSPCCRSSPCSSPCTRRRRGTGRLCRGLRSSRSASAATASTCGTGRSSCTPTPTAAPCRGSLPPWRSPRWSRSCATASSRYRCAVGISVDGGDRQASGAPSR